MRICLALIIGILFNETDFQRFLFIASIVVVIFALFLHKIFSSQLQKQWIFGVAVFVAFIAVGNVVSYICKQKKQFQMENEKGFFEVELLETPIEKSRSYLCRVNQIRFEALKSVTTTANMPTYTRRRINCEWETFLSQKQKR